MSQAKRLSEIENMMIVREAGDGVSSSELAKRFGVTSRAIRYVVKADAERQKDTAVAPTAVTIKLTPDELNAFGEVLAATGIETRSEGLNIPRIGLMIHAVMVAAIGTGEAFGRACALAALVDLVPRQYGTDGRTVLGRITKRGNR